jgi:hypothetical protein
MFSIYGHYILVEDVCSLWTLHFGRRSLLFIDTIFWQKMFALYGHHILAEDIFSLLTLHFGIGFVFY